MLAAHGLTCSMSRRGNCIDNAAMESWNSTLKSELGERFESPAHAKTKLFDYVEIFYNQERIHSSLGYATPAEFERAGRQQPAAYRPGVFHSPSVSPRAPLGPQPAHRRSPTQLP